MSPTLPPSVATTVGASSQFLHQSGIPTDQLPSPLRSPIFAKSPVSTAASGFGERKFASLTTKGKEKPQSKEQLERIKVRAVLCICVVYVVYVVYVWCMCGVCVV